MKLAPSLRGRDSGEVQSWRTGGAYSVKRMVGRSSKDDEDVYEAAERRARALDQIRKALSLATQETYTLMAPPDNPMDTFAAAKAELPLRRIFETLGFAAEGALTELCEAQSQSAKKALKKQAAYHTAKLETARLAAKSRTDHKAVEVNAACTRQFDEKLKAMASGEANISDEIYRRLDEQNAELERLANVETTLIEIQGTLTEAEGDAKVARRELRSMRDDVNVCRTKMARVASQELEMVIGVRQGTTFGELVDEFLGVFSIASNVGKEREAKLIARSAEQESMITVLAAEVEVVEETMTALAVELALAKASKKGAEARASKAGYQAEAAEGSRAASEVALGTMREECQLADEQRRAADEAADAAKAEAERWRHACSDTADEMGQRAQTEAAAFAERMADAEAAARQAVKDLRAQLDLAQQEVKRGSQKGKVLEDKVAEVEARYMRHACALPAPSWHARCTRAGWRNRMPATWHMRSSAPDAIGPPYGRPCARSLRERKSENGALTTKLKAAESELTMLKAEAAAAAKASEAAKNEADRAQRGLKEGLASQAADATAREESYRAEIHSVRTTLFAQMKAAQEVSKILGSDPMSPDGSLRATLNWLGLNCWRWGRMSQWQ